MPEPPLPSLPDPARSPDPTGAGPADAPLLRAPVEPREEHRPVPFGLLLVFSGVIFWGAWYLATYHGGWRSDVLDPDPEARLAGGAGAPEQPADPLTLGARVFRANCVACHQAQGQGLGSVYPPLAGSEWVLGPPHRTARILLAGLEGPVTVKGATYSGTMPGFGYRLTDAQVAAVLSYARQAWGHEAAPVPPEVVAAARRATQGRVLPWKAAELPALAQSDPYPVATTAPATQPR